METNLQMRVMDALKLHMVVEETRDEPYLAGNFADGVTATKTWMLPVILVEELDLLCKALVLSL